MSRRPALPALCAAVLLAAGAATAADGPVTTADVSRTGDLLCEFNMSGPRPRMARRNPDLLVVFDRLGARPAEARMVSSRKAGARSVRMYAGETGVHLVEDVTGSVVVTTLLGCEGRDRSSADRCVRYSAVNAWHFDQSVHRDADTAFRRLPGTSYSGTCEAWHMDAPKRAELP